MNKNTNISPEEFEIIERYILKQMSTKEYDDFKLKILKDEELKNKIKCVKLLLVGIQESSLAKKMENYHKEISFPQKKINQATSKVVFMKRWMIAATVILLMGLGGVLIVGKLNEDKKIFSEFFKPDPGLATVMSASTDYVFEHAMIDYKTRKYDSALKTWKDLLKSNGTNDTLNYFIGSAFLANEKSDSAILYFEKVITNNQSYFLKDAYWYLGLALVKQQKIQKAIPYIEKSDHLKKEALLLKLKK